MIYAPLLVPNPEILIVQKKLQKRERKKGYEVEPTAINPMMQYRNLLRAPGSLLVPTQQ